MSTEIVAETADMTAALGRRLADVLRPGDLVVLNGPLGAGKTALTQGIGAGLGVSERIVSPTFVIARVHRSGRVPLVHIDAYRLSSIDEIEDLELDSGLPESITVVEWGSGLVEQWAPSRLEVGIQRSSDSERRIITLQAHGPDWVDRHELLAEMARA